MIGRYLIHCYLYYQLDTAIIPDTEFDQLCKAILERWDTIEHPHKHLINVDDLKAGTGYSITLHDYPQIVKVIAGHIIDYRTRGRDYLKELEVKFEES